MKFLKKIEDHYEVKAYEGHGTLTAPTKPLKKLECDMEKGCKQPVTYIDEKGWVYCTEHGKLRKQSKRCRQLTPKELKKLQMGESIWWDKKRN